MCAKLPVCGHLSHWSTLFAADLNENNTIFWDNNRGGIERGVVWRGVVWGGVVWRGVVWRGVVWGGVVSRGVVWRRVVWRRVVWGGRFSYMILYGPSHEFYARKVFQMYRLNRNYVKHISYCIVLYCIMRPYTDGPIGPLSYRHSSGVVRNPHSTLAEWGIFNLRSMSSQGTHLLIARRRNSINSVLVTISWMTCLIATREPRTINLSIAGERITFTM